LHRHHQRARWPRSHRAAHRRGCRPVRGDAALYEAKHAGRNATRL